MCGINDQPDLCCFKVQTLKHSFLAAYIYLALHQGCVAVIAVHDILLYLFRLRET